MKVYLNKEQIALMKNLKEPMEVMKQLEEFEPNERKHPCLYYDRDYILSLKNSADKNVVDVRNKIKEEGDKAIEIDPFKEKLKLEDFEPDEIDIRARTGMPGKNTEMFAVAMGSCNSWEGYKIIRQLYASYIFTGDIRYMEGVKKWLVNYAKYTKWQKPGWTLYVPDRTVNIETFDDGQWFDTANLLRAFAEAYDIIYDDLDADEKALINKAVFIHCEKVVDDIKQKRTWFFQGEPPYANNNQYVVVVASMGLAALSFYNEFEQAKIWLDYARRYLSVSVAMLPPDGGLNESSNYDAITDQTMIPFITALAQAGDKTFIDFPAIKNLRNKYIYCMFPDFEHVLNYSESVCFKLNQPVVMQLAKIYKDKQLQYVLNKVGINYNEDFLLKYDNELDLETVDSLPTSILMMFAQKIALFRTDWTDNCIQVGFKCGAGPCHDHFDQNQIIVNAGKDLLLYDKGNSEMGYAGNYTEFYCHTRAHNTFLIDGMGQAEDSNKHREIKPNGYFAGDFFKFVSGDAASVYKVPLQKFNRKIIFIKSGYIIVHDEIISSDGENHNFEQLWHSELPMNTGENFITVTGSEYSAYIDILKPKDNEVIKNIGYATGNSKKEVFNYSVKAYGSNAEYINIINITEGKPIKLDKSYSIDDEGTSIIRINNDTENDIIAFGKTDNEHAYISIDDYSTDAEVIVIRENDKKWINIGLYEAKVLNIKGKPLIKADNLIAVSMTRKQTDLKEEITLELGISGEETCLELHIDSEISKISLNEEDITNKYKVMNKHVELKNIEQGIHVIKIISTKVV